MAVNLIKMLMDQAGDVLSENAGSMLNENPSNIKNALGGIIPSLMGSVAQKGSSSTGAQDLMDILSKGNYDGGMLDDIGGMFSGGKMDGILSQGGSLLNALIGGSQKQSGLVDMIAGFAGLKKNSATSLMSMAAPLVMSLVGKQVKGNGLDVGGLMNLLGGQTDFIKKAMPKGLSGVGNLLGFSGPLADLGAAAESARQTVESTAKKSSNWLPWALGAVALLLLLWFLFNRGDKVEEAVESATTTVVEEAEKAGEAIEEAASDIREAAVGLVGENISEYLSSGKDWHDHAFTFTNADFSSGSAQLSDRLSSEVAGLAAIMEANPAMKVKVTAHAANDQDLARQRALAIKSALQGEGIASTRVETEGALATTGNPDRVELHITSM